MRIVILGGAGQIGLVLRAGLSVQHDVFATSRSANQGVIKFDPFRDDWRALGHVDVLVNCIGAMSDTKDVDLSQVHVGITQLMLKNRPALGFPRLIQVSALGADAHHPVAFLQTKGLADELLLTHPDTIVVRPSIVCTPRTVLVRKLLMIARMARCTGGIVICPNGWLDTQLQPVMPADLVAVVNAVCYMTHHTIVEVGGADTTCFRDLLKQLAEIRKQRLTFLEVPRFLADLLVLRIIAPLYPRVINRQQYQLLFQNNTTDNLTFQQLAGRTALSTASFFKTEYQHAAH